MAVRCAVSEHAAAGSVKLNQWMTSWARPPGPTDWADAHRQVSTPAARRVCLQTHAVGLRNADLVVATVVTQSHNIHSIFIPVWSSSSPEGDVSCSKAAQSFTAFTERNSGGSFAVSDADMGTAVIKRSWTRRGFFFLSSVYRL